MSTRSVKTKSHGLLDVIKQHNTSTAQSGAPPEFTSEQTAAVVKNTALFGGPRPVYSVSRDKITEPETAADLLCGRTPNPMACACYLQAATDAILVKVDTAKPLPPYFVSADDFLEWLK